VKGEKPLERHRCRWKNNIRINLREIWWEVMGSMHLAQGNDQWRAVVNTVMNIRVP
jgi:hypothetical protein